MQGSKVKITRVPRMMITAVAMYRIIFHALNGLRIILVDFWKGGTQHHKTLLWIVLGLWVVLTLGFAIRHFSLALGGH